jgi:hypothetical protein
MAIDPTETSKLADTKRRTASWNTSAAAALLGTLRAAPVTVRAAGPGPAPRDSFLGQLAGRWTLIGTVLGKPVRYRGDGMWVLNDGWLRLALVDRGKPPAYQADVYLGFDPKTDEYIAHWLDRFGAAGARVVATGRRDGQTLVLLFPYESSPFRGTLTLAPDGLTGSSLLESQKADGTWSTFASYTLRRRR